MLVWVTLSAGFVQEAAAQTWAEFFKQKKTQKKYLLNQIAALQVYIDYARKGYELVDNGLQTIRDMTSGEFSLHNAFLSSLKQVSPAVRNDLRVAEIISMQLSVLRLSGSWGDHELLSTGNRVYISRIRSDLGDRCLDALEELLLVITTGKVEMGDEERLRRIGELYALMQEHYGFARRFTAEVNLLVRSRERELLELEQMEVHYEKGI
jgi:hypothetical protein